MDSIERLLEHNKEKSKYIKSYLTTNEMIIEMLGGSNLAAVKELSDKKRSIITSIEVLDDKIIRDLAALKEDYGVKDISDLSVSDYPLLAQLKRESVRVLRQMVDVKKSDDALTKELDSVFDSYESSDNKFYRKKLEHYTQTFFED